MTARRLWAAVEPLHAVVYFAPQTAEAAKAAGLRGYWMGYFAGRLAPLGPIGPEPATAVLFGFAPVMVARALPDAWSFASPEAEALGMTETVEHPALGVLRQAGIPFRFERTPASIRSAPPLLGEHTEAILREVGYAPDEIAELRESGAIRG